MTNGGNQPPYGASAPEGMNRPPYGASAPEGMNQPPYGASAPEGMNQPPYGAPAPEGINQPPYGASAPEGMNQPPYGASAPEGMNQPPYGAPAPEGMNQPPYGAYQPGGNYAGMQYGFDGSNPQYQQEQKSRRRKLGVLAGVIGVGVVALVAIIVGLFINRGGESEQDPVLAQSQPTESPAEPTSEAEKPTEEPEPTDEPEPTEEPEPTDQPSQPVIGGGFETHASGTVRGGGMGFADDRELVFLKTQYGIGSMYRQNGSYQSGDWAFAMDVTEDARLESFAYYDHALYLACGDGGLRRVELNEEASVSQIADGYIRSFAIAGDRLFYIVLDNEYNSWGMLYTAALDGSDPVELEEVICAFLTSGSADFEYVDGYLYYLGGSNELKRMKADATGSEVIAQSGEMDNSYVEGIYYNNGKIYIPSSYGIYAYEIAADTVEQIAECDISTYYPMVFAGDSLLYADNDWYWHQLNSAGDVRYPSELNNGSMYLEVCGGELICLSNYTEYYAVDYEGGVIGAEQPIAIDYYEAPESAGGMAAEEGGDIVVTADGGINFRASFVGYSGDDFVILKNNQWEGSPLICINGDGSHYVITDKNVMYYQVIGNEIYYTTRNSKSKLHAFWKQELTEGAQAEKLLDGEQVRTFFYRDGLIYYDSYDDYYRLYCYDPETDSSRKISDASVNFYYLLDDVIYYENLEDGTICKMGLDGSGNERLFDLYEFGTEHAANLTAFYGTEEKDVYLTFSSAEGKMYLTNEDGSHSLVVEDQLDEFDINQDIYYESGALYYSSDNSTKIHKLNITAELIGYLRGEGSADGISDEVINSESFVYFEVRDGVIYIELYGDHYEIEVIDSATGESYGTFDFF